SYRRQGQLLIRNRNKKKQKAQGDVWFFFFFFFLRVTTLPTRTTPGGGYLNVAKQRHGGWRAERPP
ncbi:hypothetical protein UQ20_15755, partial [Escherichia coli]